MDENHNEIRPMGENLIVIRPMGENLNETGQIGRKSQ